MEVSISGIGGFTLGTHRIGGWVGPRAGLHAVARKKKSQPLPGIELQSSCPQPNHYTDYATTAPVHAYEYVKYENSFITSVNRYANIRFAVSYAAYIQLHARLGTYASQIYMKVKL
jgi:hypothetical protein